MSRQFGYVSALSGAMLLLTAFFIAVLGAFGVYDNSNLDNEMFAIFYTLFPLGGVLTITGIIIGALSDD